MNHIIKIFLTGIFLSFLPSLSIAQTIVAFQGGEGTFADNWNYTAITNAGGALPPGNVTTYPRTGSFSIRAGGGNTIGCSSGVNCIAGGGAVGCPMHGKTIQFNPVNVACLPDVQLSVYHRSHVFCTGAGFDSGENLYFEVRLNGGSWVIADTVGGFSEYTWNYATSPAGSTFKTPNPFIYNVPAGTSTFEFRVRTNTNRGDEVYYIDDVLLTTSSTAYTFPGVAGYWNGAVNTNWNNICNWENRMLPVSATDVVIPNSAINICEILPFNTGNCKNLTIDKNKLAVEYFTSTLNVTGNFTLDINGELDLSLNSTEGGTMNLSGHWLNLRDETNVAEEGSIVNFTGNSTQTITVSNDTKEGFYRMGVNKSAGNVVTNESVWIDKNNNGGVLPMLSLNNGSIDLNGNELIVFNPASTAVQRINGGVISERFDNLSKMTWVSQTPPALYEFPFITASGIYIPFIINTLSGTLSQVTAATYPTPPDNLPWPVTPVTVNNLTSGIGLTPDNRDATVDRFWQVDVGGTITADLTFNYAPAELPSAPYNNASGMKGQRYNSTSDLWQPYLPGQTAGSFFVTVPAVNNFSTWTLTNDISPLPVELLSFVTVLNKKQDAELTWVTASEINNDYFEPEKSADGNLFFPLSRIAGAGNSNEILSYTYIDEFPFDGYTYYRIKQTDFDGNYSYSGITSVKKSTSEEIVSLFPNPTKNSFVIVLPENSTESSFYISEMSGKVIQHISCVNNKSTNLIEVDISKLASGIYLVKSENGFVQKLIIAE